MSSERRRRYHRKARGACKSCGDRHIRCDQERPICRNCLTKGLHCSNSQDCEMTDPGEGPSHAPTPTTFISSFVRREPSPGFDRLLGQGMFDPFNSLPVEFKHDSARMFDHFNNYRVLVRSMFRRSSGGELFDFATSDALLMHTSVLLAVNHFHLLNQLQAIPIKTFYYHKGEAIKIINARLAHTETATSTSTLGAVAAMTILESNSGSSEAALHHLDGLESLLKICGGLHTKRISPLLHRMILLADLNATSATNTKPRFQNSKVQQSKDNLFQDTERTTSQVVVPYLGPYLGGVTTNPAAEPKTGPPSPIFLNRYQLDPSSTKIFQDLHRLSTQISESAQNTTANYNSLMEETTTTERFIDFVLHNPVPTGTTINGVATNSVSCVLAGQIYFYIFLRNIPLESPVYDWIIPMFREDLTRPETLALEIFPPELVFWVLFLGGLVALHKPDSAWFQEQLRIVVERLGLGTWEEARACLESLVWMASDGEAGSRSEVLWSEIMKQDRWAPGMLLDVNSPESQM